jgi:hypothetical protein
MKRFTIVEKLVVLAVVVMLLALVADLPLAYVGRYRGQADAARDLAAHRLTLKSAGLPRYWTDEYNRLLAERYGVTNDHFAGCVVGSYETEYMDAYNGVMLPAIGARHGPIPFDALCDEAVEVSSAALSQTPAAAR